MTIEQHFKRISDEELQVIRERCEKATPGPWGVMHDETIIAGREEEICTCWNTFNAEFIAHAREDVPRLLDEVERLEKENKDLRQTNDWLRKENKKLSDGLHEACNEEVYLRAVLDEYKKCEEEYANQLVDAYAEIRRLREVLEFYAEEDNYNTHGGDASWPYHPIMDDKGRRARQALSGGDGD